MRDVAGSAVQGRNEEMQEHLLAVSSGIWVIVWRVLVPPALGPCALCRVALAAKALPIVVGFHPCSFPHRDAFPWSFSCRCEFGCAVPISPIPPCSALSIPKHTHTGSQTALPWAWGAEGVLSIL